MYSIARLVLVLGAFSSTVWAQERCTEGPGNRCIKSYSCSYERNFGSTMTGSAKVSLRQYTINEICDADLTLTECRRSLAENLESAEFIQQLNTKVDNLKDHAPALARELKRELAKAERSTSAIIDLLLSRRKIALNIHSKESNRVGPGTMSFSRVSTLEGSYGIPSIFGNEWVESADEREGRNTAIERFLDYLGGGITSDPSRIFVMENPYYARAYYVDEWFLGERIGPKMFFSIVGNSLVVTSHSRIGKQPSVRTFPITMGEPVLVETTTGMTLNGVTIIQEVSDVFNCKFVFEE